MNRNVRPILMVVVGLILIAAALAAILTNPFDKLGEDQPLATATILPGAEESYPEINRVSLGDAKAAYDLKQAVFVDTRGLDAYNQSHIPGAVSIPINELESRLGELNKNDWIITYCTWPQEETSARAAKILLDNGFTHANPIAGGFQAWVAKGYPVEP